MKERHLNETPVTAQDGMGIESFVVVVWEENSVGLTPNKFTGALVEAARYLSLQPNEVSDAQFRFGFFGHGDRRVH